MRVTKKYWKMKKSKKAYLDCGYEGGGDMLNVGKLMVFYENAIAINELSLLK